MLDEAHTREKRRTRPHMEQKAPIDVDEKERPTSTPQRRWGACAHTPHEVAVGRHFLGRRLLHRISLVTHETHILRQLFLEMDID